MRLFKIVMSTALAACMAWFVAHSWRWPLVSDASVIHYVVFLTHHGFAPYRDILDMNYPGCYLMEDAAIRIFGGGAMGWRLFDFSLLAGAAAGMMVLTKDWFGGILAGSLFALLHGRDGMPQAGQRDLSMAVLLILGLACLFLCLRQKRWAWMLPFGFLTAAAGIVKPIGLPLAVALLALAIHELRRGGTPWQKYLLAACAGLALPLALGLVYLVHYQALLAFFEMQRHLVPYYASLGRRPLAYLLQHSAAPAWPLLLLWLPLALFPVPARKERNWERTALFTTAAFGLLSYCVQGKGYPYHRYLLLAALLAIAARDLAACLAETNWRRTLAVVTILLAVCFLAPVSAAKTGRFTEWNQQFLAHMEGDLATIGAPRLSGNVQCMDMTVGCITALYDMRLVQATGMISDCYVLASDATPAVGAVRRRYWARLMLHPPSVFVVTDEDCATRAGAFQVSRDPDYQKLQAWPRFGHYLATHYKLVRAWTPMPPPVDPRQVSPFGYRMYVRNDLASQPAP